MQGREFRGGEITFEPTTGGTRRHPTEGTRITLGHVKPRMQIDVFPKHVTISSLVFEQELHGRVKYRWGGRKLLVDAVSEDYGTRLLADHEGRVYFINDLDLIGNEHLRILTGGKISRSDGELLEQYSVLDINNASTFDCVKFGDIVRFFRDEHDMTQQEFAAKGDINVSTVQKIESGLYVSTKMGYLLSGVFEWQVGDPRIAIAIDAWRRTKK